MHIKPSAAIRKNYNDIASICKSTGEPVYLTKNGEGDLVVMDMEAFVRRESVLKLRENLCSKFLIYCWNYISNSELVNTEGRTHTSRERTRWKVPAIR